MSPKICSSENEAFVKKASDTSARFMAAPQSGVGCAFWDYFVEQAHGRLNKALVLLSAEGNNQRAKYTLG